MKENPGEENIIGVTMFHSLNHFLNIKTNWLYGRCILPPTLQQSWDIMRIMSTLKSITITFLGSEEKTFNFQNYLKSCLKFRKTTLARFRFVKKMIQNIMKYDI